MRKTTIVLAAGLVGCGGAKAKQDSVARDTIAAPPTVAVAPESLASPARSRVTSTKVVESPSWGRLTPPKPDTRFHTTPTRTIALDTLRGIVSVTGTSFDKHVMVAPPDGAKRVEITGPLRTIIMRLGGTDVWVSGRASGTTLEAGSFIVRTVEGAPAIDGILKSEGSNLFIITADGSRTLIVSPPAPLVGHDGARVWITGDPSRGVSAFGRIDPP